MFQALCKICGYQDRGLAHRTACYLVKFAVLDPNKWQEILRRQGLGVGNKKPLGPF